uniref:Cholesterol 25-hydroxylase n=1 Tax=Cairina moschata TaxID=8855 RepID=A0A8C3GIE1_CAIMO
MNCSVPDGVLHCYAMDRQQDRLCLQFLWDFVTAKKPLINSPFFPVLFSFTAYMAFCLPYIALDFFSTRLPNLRKYKIQPQNYPTLGMMVPCIIQSAYHHVVWIFPVTFLHWYWKPVNLPVIAPELPEVLLQVVICLLLFDFEYFLWHLLHHRVPWLYKTFHKVHHKHVSTFALTTQYSSVWELLSLGFFAAINPLLLGCHPLTEMIFFLVLYWSFATVPFNWY